MYKAYYNSPLGKLLLASDGKNLTGLWFEGQKHYLSNIKQELELKENLDIFNETKIWLNKYFKKQKPSIEVLNLKPEGSKFRVEVWKTLCKIPYGEVITYGDIAKEVATKMNKKTMSAQAIGGAVSHNPIGIIIPCHRVIGSDGSLTGYAGGIDKKIKLLEIEDVAIKEEKVCKKM